MAYKIYFKHVGVRKQSWEAILPDAQETTIIKEIKRKRATASSLIDVYFDEEMGEGAIYAGFRMIGLFTAEEEKKEKK